MNFEEFRVLPKGKKEEYLFKALHALADHNELEFEDEALIGEEVAPNAQEGYTEEPTNG